MVISLVSTLEASFATNERYITFRNTFHESISGVLQLSVPDGWDVRPNKFAFALQSGQEFREAVRLRFPISAEAGLTSLLGEFSLDANRRYRILAPAWFELGLDDMHTLLGDNR